MAPKREDVPKTPLKYDRYCNPTFVTAGNGLRSPELTHKGRRPVRVVSTSNSEMQREPLAVRLD